MDWHKFKNSCHLVNQRLEKQLRIFLSDSEEEDIGTQDPKISNLDVVEIYPDPSLIYLERATAQENGIFQQGSATGFTNEDQISPDPPLYNNVEKATAQEDGIFKQGSETGFRNEDHISPGPSNIVPEIKILKGGTQPGRKKVM